MARPSRQRRDRLVTQLALAQGPTAVQGRLTYQFEE